MQFNLAGCQDSTLAIASAWREPGFIFEEKMDGIRALVRVRATGRASVTGCLGIEITKPVAARWRSGWHRALAGCAMDCELMPSGELFIFDLPMFSGRDWRKAPLRERKQLLANAAEFFPRDARAIRFAATFDGLGEFGEGVVIKDLESEYGRGWWRAKRTLTHDVPVVHVDHDTRVARVIFSGNECGVSNVPAFVRAGDIIEVKSFHRAKAGALRNAQFVKLRDDKMGAAAWALNSRSICANSSASRIC